MFGADSEAFAFLGAVIFAIHPVNIESVVYISSVQELLYTFFLLLGFWLLTCRQETLTFKLSLPFLLALLSKESAIVAIPIFSFYLWFVVRKKGVALPWLTSSLLVFGIYFFLRTFVAKIPLSAPHLSPTAQASFYNRLLTIPFEIFSYLRLIFFPLNLAVAQHQVVKSIGDPRFWGALLLVVVSLLGLIYLLSRFKHKLAWFFFFWFILSLGLVLNIFPLDMTIAERWLYFPSIGFLGLVAVLLLRAPKIAKFWTVLSITIIILFSLRTIARTFNWRSGLALFSHDIKLTKDAFDLENNLGVELFRVGRIAEAKPHFEKSIKLQPNWWTSFNNLGVAYERERNLQEAKELYRQSIAHGDYYLAYENLSRLMLKTDKPDETIQFLTQALQKIPQNSNLLLTLALAYYQKQEFTEAETFAKQAFFLSPTQNNKLIPITIIQRKPIE